MIWKILPWGLFAALLVANGAYLYGQGGFSGPDAGTPPPKADPVVAELALSDDQAAALENLRLRVSEERKAMGEEVLPLRREMLSFLVADNFDAQGLNAVMDEMSGARRAYFLGVLQGLHGYLQTLEPEQRETFMTLAEDQGFFRRLLMPREEGGS